jgi:hypothetical protein
MKGMTSLNQASLHEINRVKRVRVGVGHEGDDQPASSFSA